MENRSTVIAGNWTPAITVLAARGGRRFMGVSRVLPWGRWCKLRVRDSSCGQIRLVALVWALVALAAPHILRAQVAGGSLGGMVTGASGDAFPGAQVFVTDMKTGTSRAVATDTVGFYTIPDLAPGTYELRISAAGYVTQARTGITVTVGARPNGVLTDDLVHVWAGDGADNLIEVDASKPGPRSFERFLRAAHIDPYRYRRTHERLLRSSRKTQQFLSRCSCPR